ncbi:hypothetical protein BDR22DRAFT_873925 [Usnea florida]
MYQPPTHSTSPISLERNLRHPSLLAQAQWVLSILLGPCARARCIANAAGCILAHVANALSCVTDSASRALDGVAENITEAADSVTGRVGDASNAFPHRIRRAAENVAYFVHVDQLI